MKNDTKKLNGTDRESFALWVERIAQWISHGDVPRIPYAGFTQMGCKNPSSPCVQFSYSHKSCRKYGLNIGDRYIERNAGDALFCNVHFGNASDIFFRDLRSWCLFLDVSDVPELAGVEKSPLVCTMPIADPDLLIEAFEKIGAITMESGHEVSRGFIEGPVSYNPELLSDHNESKRLRLKAAVLELLAIFLTEAGMSSAGGWAPVGAVRVAIEFMGRNYMHHSLRLPEVAAAAGCSSDHFGRIFGKQAGISPMQYLRQIRIERARLLIQHSALRISEISAAVGFGDPLHFSRVFRSLSGMSPREFKKQVSKQTKVDDNASK
jgi:AraC-like DNA-binding protein